MQKGGTLWCQSSFQWLHAQNLRTEPPGFFLGTPGFGTGKKPGVFFKVSLSRQAGGIKRWWWSRWLVWLDLCWCSCLKVVILCIVRGDSGEVDTSCIWNPSGCEWLKFNWIWDCIAPTLNDSTIRKNLRIFSGAWHKLHMGDKETSQQIPVTASFHLRHARHGAVTPPLFVSSTACTTPLSTPGMVLSTLLFHSRRSLTIGRKNFTKKSGTTCHYQSRKTLT